MWNTALEYLDLKDDAKPVLLLPYSVLRVNEDMFRKKVEILEKLGVLKEANDSKWVAPYFAHPKVKTN